MFAQAEERSETLGATMLVVDDDPLFRDRLARALRGRGLEVRTAADLDEGVRLAREESPELAVVDLRMPGGSGLELVKELKAIDPTTKVVVLTGYGSIATAVDAVRLGAINYLQKPADADDVLAAFARGESPPLEPPAVSYQVPSLERVEWEHIQRVLADCAGNISEGARRLGLHRRTLQRKLQKYPPRR
ncbi:MAG: response regulator transcription factor [Deltaproteobacteria bacterium]|nr:response regulator transcription factor [Deltaproteobacteria bacterium]